MILAPDFQQLSDIGLLCRELLLMPFVLQILPALVLLTHLNLLTLPCSLGLCLQLLTLLLALGLLLIRKPARTVIGSRAVVFGITTITIAS